MELLLGNGQYMICSDERQFVVKKLKTVKASRLTKEKNVGKEYFEDFAYCRDLSFAIKTIGNQVVLDNKELPVIIEKLSELQTEINKITNLLELSIPMEDNNDEN